MNPTALDLIAYLQRAIEESGIDTAGKEKTATTGDRGGLSQEGEVYRHSEAQRQLSVSSRNDGVKP